MELKGVLSRVERRLKELDLSADAASRQAGKPDAIRNMRRAVKAGRQGVNTATIAALAPVLKTNLAWLLEGKRAKEPAEEGASMVPLKGYVGAGAEAHFYAVAQGDLDEVPAPAGSTDHTVAVEIRGESLGPFFDRWLVFYDDVRRPVTDDLFGALCVVGLSDGRVLIKKLRPGKRGRFSLISAAHEPPIENVELEWAAKVKFMSSK